jgi:hypothetical protein
MKLSYLPVAAALIMASQIALASSLPSPSFQTITVTTISGGPTFTTSPTVPTASAGDNTGTAASDAFVTAGILVETNRATAAEGTLTTSVGTANSNASTANTNASAALSTANSASTTANAALPNTTTALGALYASWFSGLPTTLPGTSGQFWNNGGILSKS